MLEIPEAAGLVRQLNQTVFGKTIRQVIAAQNPHGFAWYHGDPSGYASLMVGKKIGNAVNPGGMVEIVVEDVYLLFSDGINLRYHQTSSDQPLKHQLLIVFEDSTSISATVAMYGGLSCFPQGTNDNPYYLAARQKTSPLADAFSKDYFMGLFLPGTENHSLKAFLATEQRIPGLGNGVLQDILFNAQIHPKRKVLTLSSQEIDMLFHAIKRTLKTMADLGGRDTEKDLFGNPGGYQTRMSKNTVGQPCQVCGNLVIKQAYMGGSVYFCPVCQTESLPSN
jgi:formamidopyrimidine-DNA glycosylase